MKNHLHALTLILFALIAFQSKAYYTMGSEISYKCTSTPNVYTVTMKIYRDCSGLALCSGCNNSIPNGNTNGCTTATSGWTMSIIGGNSPCTGVTWGSFTLNAAQTLFGGYDIIQTCTSVRTICTNCNTRNAGTFSPGIEVYTYEGNVNLSNIPATCCKIILGATANNRKSSSTLSSTNYFTYCEINRCQSSCNSAPIFTNDEVAAVCAGVDFVYNLGANDPDGDSLSYAFGNSLQSLNTPVAYISPYGRTNPFPYLNAPDSVAPFPAGLRIDPITGDIMFRPVGTFVSNLVLEVTQWKLVSGVRVNVGITRRDIQFQSISCAANKAPIIKVYKNNLLQPGTNSFTAFAGVQFCLDIVTEDQGQTSPLIISDTTDLRWSYPINYYPTMANATFTRNYILSQRPINGPKADSIKFCWTPPLSAIRPEPYLFTISGSDRFCPLNAKVTRGITIKVEAPKTIFVDSTTKRNYCINKITSSNLNYQAIGLNLLPNNVFTAQLSDSSGSFINATTIGAKITIDTVGFIPISFPAGLLISKNYKIRINASSDTNNLGTPYAINILASINTPTITTNKDTLCKGMVATYKVTPNTPDLTFKWLKNNVLITNQTKDSLLVDSAYNYRAIVSNAGCSDTSSAKYLTVFSAGFSINNSGQCLRGNNFIFTDTSNKSTGITKRLWSINNVDTSTNIITTKSFNNTGTYNVKLVVTSIIGCRDSLTKIFNVYPQPGSTITAIGNSTFCANSNITLKAVNTANHTITWLKNGIQIPNIQDSILIANSIGAYKLVTKNAFNCIDTSEEIVTNTYPVPVVNFIINNPTQCINGNSFTFTDSSTIATGTINRKWNLGMGINDTSLLANIVKVYPTANTYSVKLVETSNNGCKDSITKTIIVNPKPIVDFSSPNLFCLNNSNSTFIITNNSTISSGNLSYNWQFSDKTSSSLLNPIKTISDSGNLVIKLIATSNNNCKDSITKTTLVNFKPNAGFTINKINQCLNGNLFSFTDTSKIAVGTFTRKWNFGTNASDTSTNTNPTKTYNLPNTYIVKLITTSNNSCKDSVTANVSIIPNVSANFNINNASQCLNKNNFIFTNTSANSNAQTWSFGDTSNSAILSPTKTYINAGNYNVKLVAKNNANCPDSITKTVTIYPQPIASFSINNPSQCLNGNNFLFTDNSSIASGTINRLWLFNNGDTSTNTNAYKSYFAVGTFGVKLTVKSDKNCLDTISKTVTVTPNLIIGNILGNTNPTSTINPYSYSVLNQANVTYNWTATNGTIQSGQGTNAISVVWANAGAGSINAKITNTNNCTDSTNLAVNLTKVGINNLSLDNDLKVYPNPTKTSITITNKTNLTGKKYIITNLVGQTIISGKLNLDETIVNLESLQSGMYLLSIDGLNKQSIKVIKE